MGWLIERDSRKDEAVVLIFILATSGLLAWAVLRPWVQGWVEVSSDTDNKVWEMECYRLTL